MKEAFKDLRCPHCGAKDFNIVAGDVFLCEYCKQNFNYNVDDISLTDENSVFVEELKTKFNEKIVELYEKKRVSRACLLYYKKLTNPKKLLVISEIILALSSFLFLVGLFSLFESYYTLIFSAVGLVVSLPLFLFARARNKSMTKKYQPFVSYYAAKIADYDTEINLYSKLISKLTR